MIRLITGATQISGRLYRPESGAFEAGKEVEKYLVGRGVAEYVDGSTPSVVNETITATEPSATEQEPEDAPDLTAETPTKKPAAKKPTGKKS